MASYLQKYLHKFQHLEILLEEIKSATDNFNSKNCIGVGGYGKVYKGEVSHYRGRSMVAIKRLGSSSGQGVPEFLKEITTLSRYSHENLISLVGFCYQGEEMILVYEHASQGSLDRYLNSPHLKWSQRIKICLDAAKGLRHLHDPGETHQRLIHCDIKSANILLDDQWNAKVSDLGLSVMGSANEQQSLIVTLAAGTLGYCDPEYAMTHTLMKESDVYSFGVVLFEVLCGTLCYAGSNGRNQKTLVPTWIESYKQNKLSDIIFNSLSILQPLDQGSLEIYSDIAYRCLNESREDRPQMSEVVTELQTALGVQEFIETNPFFDYEEMAKSAEPPLKYRSKVELWKLLLEVVLLNKGKTWLTLNKKGEVCELISFAECLVSGPGELKPARNSRFDARAIYLNGKEKYTVRVKTQFLSPGITYTMNLMCRVNKSTVYRPDPEVSLEYTLEGETETSSYTVFKSDCGNWSICELYHIIISDRRDHEILFTVEADYDIVVEGIDFRPLEEVKHTTDEKQPISDSDADWEEKLPTDYADIIKRSTDGVHWTTKKEAYSILRKGFLINDGQEWFSLDKNGKKCVMLSPRAALDTFFSKFGSYLSLPESRFGEAFQSDEYLNVKQVIKLELLPSKTTYATYLVYKIPNGFETYRPTRMHDFFSYWYCFLESPQTPVIRPKVHQKTHNPTNRLPIIKGIPRQRDDGWMEVQIWEFQTPTTEGAIRLNFSFDKKMRGLIVQGFEFRPV